MPNGPWEKQPAAFSEKSTAEEAGSSGTTAAAETAPAKQAKETMAVKKLLNCMVCLCLPESLTAVVEDGEKGRGESEAL